MITYSATLDVPADTATLLTDLLIAERRRPGTGIVARAATRRTQPFVALRYDRTALTITALARLAAILICARRLPTD